MLLHVALIMPAARFGHDVDVSVAVGVAASVVGLKLKLNRELLHSAQTD